MCLSPKVRPMDTTTSYSGLGLKLLRISRRIKQYQLAQEMEPPVARARIASIEREAFPSPETVRRYLAALERCTDSGTALAPEEQGAA